MLLWHLIVALGLWHVIAHYLHRHLLLLLRHHVLLLVNLRLSIVISRHHIMLGCLSGWRHYVWIEIGGRLLPHLRRISTWAHIAWLFVRSVSCSVIMHLLWFPTFLTWLRSSTLLRNEFAYTTFNKRKTLPFVSAKDLVFFLSNYCHFYLILGSLIFGMFFSIYSDNLFLSSGVANFKAF